MKQILIGTYTRNESQGIYALDLDENSQQLVNLRLIAPAQNPTYLDFDAETKTLYSVMQEGDAGGVGVWDFHDQAILKEKYLSETTPPCYVKYDRKEQCIYDANYHLGSVHVYKNNEVQKVIQYDLGAKAHFADLDPKTDDLFVCDLGWDAIYKYRLLNEIAVYETPQGFGPRHLAFHPTQPIIYAFGELSSEVIVLKDEEFELIHMQTINTLPDDEDQIKSGAAIRISNDGHFLYVSNRGHDSITVFRIDANYTLTWLDNVSTYGQHPRDFMLSFDNHYLVVANKDTNNLTLFANDIATGKLTVLQKDIAVPEPVSILFI